jgi:uncharacterized protein (TIGR03086 family)
MPQIDIRPAAERMARLLEAVPEDALDAPTPCDDTSLGGLIAHIGTFAVAFQAAAAKDLDKMASSPPGPVDLEPGWRTRVPADLTALAAAWQSPSAWEGMTKAGGIDLPGEVAGRVALDELVVHAWDIARASGQPFDCDDETLREIEATVRQFRGDNMGDMPGLFGPVVPVPDDAPLLHQLLGLTGRDPGWAPA